MGSIYRCAVRSYAHGRSPGADRARRGCRRRTTPCRGHPAGGRQHGPAGRLHHHSGRRRLPPPPAAGDAGRQRRGLDDGLPPAAPHHRPAAARDSPRGGGREDSRGRNPCAAPLAAGRHGELQRRELHRGAGPHDCRRAAQDAGHRGRKDGRNPLQRRAHQQVLHRGDGPARRPLLAGDEQHPAAGRGQRRGAGEPPAHQGAERHRPKRPCGAEPPPERTRPLALDGVAARRRRLGLRRGALARLGLRHAPAASRCSTSRETTRGRTPRPTSRS